MCGIAGVYASRPDVLSQHDLAAAVAQMAHRGPDASGRWSDSRRIAFGHTRLKIIDLTEGGAQPMVSHDGRIAVIYNGEIYNFRELGARFGVTTDSDTRLLTELWARLGPACLAELNGMFAAAVWDQGAGTLHLVRDRFGVKPLYYTRQGESLLFASEARVLARMAGVSSVNHDAIADVLLFGSVIGRESWYTGIRSVTPGCYLEVGEGGEREVRWWAPKPRNFEQKEFEELLWDATRVRLVSDVPVGVFLSSGMDSRAILRIAAEQGGDVSAFTVSFESDRIASDEGPAARSLCERLGVPHHVARVSDADGARHARAWLETMDQPTVDGLNSFIVSKLARRHVVVALSGLGADEVLGGYSTFKLARLLDRSRRLVPGGRLPDLRTRLSWEPAWREVILGRLAVPPDTLGDYLAVRAVAPLELVAPEASASVTERARAAREALGGPLPGLAETSALELTLYLQSTLLRDADSMSMRHSLEVRFPFLDGRLVEPTLGPEADRFMSWRGSTKRPLRRYLARLGVPPEDGRKLGFSVPLARWIRDPELADLFAELLWNDRAGREIYGVKRMHELLGMVRAGEIPSYRALSQVSAVAAVNFCLGRNGR